MKKIANKCNAFEKAEKKYLRIFFCIACMFYTGVSISFGQIKISANGDTIYITGGTLAGFENAGLLEATINGDTLTSGARKNPNRVYALNEGQVYVQQNPLIVVNPTGTLNIVGIASQYGTTKPIWLMKSAVAGTPILINGNGCNVVYGSINFQNLHYQAMQLDGTLQYENFYCGTKNSLPQSLTINNCLFEFSYIDLFDCTNESGSIGGWPNGAKFKITNSYFRNLWYAGQWWASRILQCKHPIDTLWVENITTTGGGLTFLQQNEMTDFAYFNHNTIVNNHKYWTLSPFYHTLIVTNNIFLNENWVGEDSTVTQSGQDPDKQFVSLINLDTIDAYHQVAVQSKYSNGSGGYTSDLALKNLKIYVSNNINYYNPLLNAYFTNANYFYDTSNGYVLADLGWFSYITEPQRVNNMPGEWMNTRTKALFTAYAPHNGGFVEEYTTTANPFSFAADQIKTNADVELMGEWNQNLYSDPRWPTAPNTNVPPFIYGDYDPTTIPGGGTETGGGITNFTDLPETFAGATVNSTIDGLPVGALIWDNAKLAAYNSATDFLEVMARYNFLLSGGTIPSVPILSSPSNGSTGISANPALSWNASSGAISYRLQVSADSAFATTLYDQANLKSLSQNVSGLLAGKKYYWHVDATDSAGTSAWSALWSFTTLKESSWSIGISASANGMADGACTMGVDSNATDGFDKAYDIPKPPSPAGNYVYAYFAHPEWNSVLGPNFSTDIRQNADFTTQWKVWTFTVTTDQANKTMLLQFSLNSVPAAYPVILKDMNTGTNQNLHALSSYTYNTGTNGVRTFQIIAGSVPRIAITSVSTLPGNTFFSSIAPLSYSLTLSAPDTINLLCSYALTSDTTKWFPTTNISGKASALTVSGLDTLYWNCVNDLPTAETAVKFKIIPYDIGGRGDSAVSNIFIVDRKAPRFNGLSGAGFDTSKLGRIFLRWSAGTDLSVPLTYRIFGGDTLSTVNYAMQIDSTTDTTWISKDLSQNTSYYYGVRAVDKAGNMDTNSVSRAAALPMLADFNGDGKINAADLTIFRSAWLTDDTVTGDIGPAVGTPPNWQSKRDHSIDFEDVMTLALGWEWSAANPSVVEASRKKPARFVPSVELFDAKASMTIKAKGIMPLPLKFNGKKEYSGIDCSIHYDTAKIVVDSITSPYSNQMIFFKHIDNAKGYSCVSFVSIGDSLYKYLANPECLTLWITAKQNLNNEPIALTSDVYDDRSRLLDETEQTIQITCAASIPIAYALLQNYPNPFNPTTTIQYELPQQTYVNIKIYDMLGREVATLVDESKSAGRFSVIWNASRFASGVYFYRLKADRFTSVRKLLLIK